MTISGAMSLFIRAEKSKTELEYICSSKDTFTVEHYTLKRTNTIFADLLGLMNELGTLGNTRNNREKLQDFLIRYSFKITNEFEDCVSENNRKNDVYSFKG